MSLSEEDLARIDARCRYREVLPGKFSAVRTVHVSGMTLHKLVAEVRRLRGEPARLEAAIRALPDYGYGSGYQAGCDDCIELISSQAPSTDTGTGRWEKQDETEWGIVNSEGSLFLTLFDDGWELGTDTMRRPKVTPDDLRAAARIIEDNQ